jgi:hypothetical protein
MLLTPLRQMYLCNDKCLVGDLLYNSMETNCAAEWCLNYLWFIYLLTCADSFNALKDGGTTNDA